MQFERAGHSLSTRKPKTIEDLQDFIKMEFKAKAKDGWDVPDTINLAGSCHPRQVVEWCVEWINTCVTYKKQNLKAVLNEVREPHHHVYQIVTELCRSSE